MLPRGWAALIVLAGAATTAQAQTVSDGLGIERFRGAIDRDGIANVESASVLGHLQWDAGLLIGFAHDPLVVYSKDMSALESLVGRRLTTTLIGAVGLGTRFELGAAVDIVGYQSGDSSTTMKSLPTAGLGDLRVTGKAFLTGNARYQLAVLATLTAPGGGARGFLREAGVTFAPALALSVRQGRLRGALDLGYLVRKSVDTAGLVSDDEAFARAGIAALIGDERAPVAEAFVAVSIASPLTDIDKNQIAAELLGGASRQLSPTLSAFAAGGVGLDNGFGTPDWRVLAGVRFGSPARVAPVRPPLDGPDIVRTPPPTKLPPVVAPEPVQLTIRVVDPNGRGIAGAGVTVGGPTNREPLVTSTDDDGRATLPVLPGSISISTTAAEYQEGATTVEVIAGKPASATVTLVRKVRQGQLRGQVLSFDGKPVAAATIKVSGASAATTQTDTDGNFTVDLPAGAFQVEITADGYKTQKRSVSIKLDGVTVLNVDLRSAK